MTNGTMYHIQKQLYAQNSPQLKNEMEIIIMTLTDIINAQETTKRGTDYVEYTSKKKLSDAGVLTTKQQEVIESLKNTFSLKLHRSNKYIVATLYIPKTKEYQFYVITLDEDMTTVQSDSIKNAKKLVSNMVGETVVSETAQEADVTEQPLAPVETPVVEDPTQTAAETVKKPRGRRAANKETSNENK